jgi:pimeloyl-ACP methyl ester carboxylesterase
MKEINFNGLQIYDYEGKGLPLVFVHAFPLNSKMYKPQVEFYKDKFRVITYDVRGLGKSKSSNNQFTLEKYSDDFLSVINHLGLEKIIACGVSMGGYIILRSYIKNPDVFSKIILADTRAERDDNTGLINRSNVIASILAGKRNEFASSFLQKLINKKSYENAELKNFLEGLIDENSDEGICGAQLALGTRVNSIDYLDKFNVPTLIIVGEDDVLTPPSCAETMNKLIKNSELKIIKDSGHLSNLENPAAFNSSILDFIR